MKMKICGSSAFLANIKSRLASVSADFCPEEIIWEEAAANGILFFGWVESKFLFPALQVLQEDFSARWTDEFSTVDVKDRQALLDYQKQCLADKRWMSVKQLNLFLMELDHFEKRTVVSYYPRNLQIEHTNVCNSRCIMCVHYFNKNHNGKFVDDSFIQKIEPLLPYLERITLHGIGEPFLHPDILRFIRLYHSYGIRLTATTNASVMTPELAEAIHQAFYSITVSCDACTKETFESIRGGLCFETFLKNVRMLRSAGDQLPMRMSTVAMRQNLHELPGIVRLAAELKFDLVVISDITTQELMRNVGDSIKCFPATAAHYLLEAEKAARECGIQIQYPEYILEYPQKRTFEEEQAILQSMPRFHDSSVAEEMYRMYEDSGFYEPCVRATRENFVIPSEYRCEGICDFVMERPYLNLRGEVYLCCTNWMHVTGNIMESSGFEEIWNGTIYQGIRQLFYEHSIPKFCVGCIFLRNQIMVSRIRVTNEDSRFYQHNYDATVRELMKKNAAAHEN